MLPGSRRSCLLCSCVPRRPRRPFALLFARATYSSSPFIKSLGSTSRASASLRTVRGQAHSPAMLQAVDRVRRHAGPLSELPDAPGSLSPQPPQLRVAHLHIRILRRCIDFSIQKSKNAGTGWRHRPVSGQAPGSRSPKEDLGTRWGWRTECTPRKLPAKSEVSACRAPLRGAPRRFSGKLVQPKRVRRHGDRLLPVASQPAQRRDLCPPALRGKCQGGKRGARKSAHFHRPRHPGGLHSPADGALRRSPRVEGAANLVGRTLRRTMI